MKPLKAFLMLPGLVLAIIAIRVLEFAAEILALFAETLMTATDSLTDYAWKQTEEYLGSDEK